MRATLERPSDAPEGKTTPARPKQASPLLNRQRPMHPVLDRLQWQAEPELIPFRKADHLTTPTPSVRRLRPTPSAPRINDFEPALDIRLPQ